MYIVSAHMDGRGGGEAADDDASGCAVVLELARVLAAADVQTNRSVRFIFWNNEEFGMDGSGTYASERASLQGTAAEPKWLGRHPARHDDVRSRHAARIKQAANADINIEYQIDSRMAADSAKLATALQTANRSSQPVSLQRSARIWPARIPYAFRILLRLSVFAKTRGSRASFVVQIPITMNRLTNWKITLRKTIALDSILRKRPSGGLRDSSA